MVIMTHIPKANPKNVTNGKAWTRAEDDIILLLYNNVSLNLSARDISEGLFHRTKTAVNGRIYLHRMFNKRFKKVIK